MASSSRPSAPTYRQSKPLIGNLFAPAIQSPIRVRRPAILFALPSPDHRIADGHRLGAMASAGLVLRSADHDDRARHRRLSPALCRKADDRLRASAGNISHYDSAMPFESNDILAKGPGELIALVTVVSLECM